MTITCPQCQHKNPDDAEFCENCGAQLPVPSAIGAAATALATPVPVAGSGGAAQDGLICPTCKAPYTVGDVFCFNCGSDLSKLPANLPAGIANPGNGQATEVAKPALEVAPPPKPKDDGMSPDDWDNAFAAPPNSPAVATPPTPVPVAPVPATPSADNNAFGIAVSTPDPTTLNTAPAKSDKLKLQIKGPYGEEVIEYKGQEILLGRQDAKTRVFPDLNLDDSAASRRHLSIWKEASDSLFYVQDLESSNGTILNGRDLETGTPIQLNNGDVIKIGTLYSIQVQIS